ncbi:hypothetical protein HYH02_001078 [Chlamydomonas schloesseri]|uniref:LysM domain-containing protein n=1 Tax=Chlamydomonas schloesseri TaxID=2026947 RepID=A0A835WV82_9CHLO|nr:hypothetical protein HYH02_001078 [Chlamydomonas schloesseri]|eukprot:KAG2454037.1 hypothetical protein HYH02_001078 [Chlamydomonas schloesseri]
MQSLRASPLSSVRTCSSRQRLVVRAAAFDVRPYTLRKGDTLESIAKKRSVTVDQILGINPDVKPGKVVEGQTILLPANKLSERDREILGGIGTTYRVYPIRAGETLTEVLSKRGISTDEFLRLNPGVDMKAVKDNQIVKLPIDKFTVREREMLIGSGILPPEFFHAAKNPFVIGLGGLMLVCGFVMAWQRFHSDPDMQATD